MEEDGLSLSDILKIIWKKRTLVIVVFCIALLASYLFIYFGYNQYMTNYNLKFNYFWVRLDENQFANNSVFNCYDIVSIDNIIDTINSDSKYQAFDEAKIKDNISIKVDDNNYVITLNTVIGNDLLTKDFLVDLAEIPYEYAANLKFDFSANLKGYNDSNKIFDKINYLDKQIKLIKEGYSEFINYFGNIEIEGKKVGDYLEEIEVFVLNDPIDTYKYQAFNNTFMTKTEFINSKNELQILLMEKGILSDRKQHLLDSIHEIYGSSYSTTFIDNAIMNYLNSMHEIDLQIVDVNENIDLINNAISGKYNEEKSEEFLTILDKYAKKLEEFTNDYANNITEGLKQNTFININEFNVEGRINNFINIVISSFIGLFISFGIVFLVGKYKQ